MVIWDLANLITLRELLYNYEGCGNGIRESCTCGFVSRIHGFVLIRGHKYWLQEGSISALSNNGSWILTWKDLFWMVNHESSQFSKIRPVFTNPANPHESSQILSTIAWNESLKKQIHQSRILTNPGWRTRESGYGNPNLKDLYRGFNL